MDEAPYAPLFAPNRTTVRSARVGGFYLHPVYLIDPLGLWIEE
jgi:ABC-type transport system substrate-binding protein